MHSDSEWDSESEPGLYLQVVNVDKKQVYYLGDLFHEGDASQSFGMESLIPFKTFEWKPLGELMEKEGIKYRKMGVPRGLGQLEIPEELIYLIFDHIDGVRTAFRLGAANTRLMIIGERRIKELMDVSNWTGVRLICVEDGDHDIDLPEGLDTGDVYGDFERHEEPCTHEDLAEGLESDTPEYRIAYDLAIPMSIEPEVIWNLTKNVYVRADAIPEDITSEFPDEYIMGWILLLYIIWTNSDELHRGKWAGDRFELTGKDVLKTRLKEDGRKWTNVSKKAVKLLSSSCVFSRILGLARAY